MSSLLPAKYNLRVWEDNTVRKRVTVLSAAADSSPMDLTGYIASMPVYSPGNSVPIFTLDTTNGGLALGGTAGTVDIYVAATQFPTRASYIYELTLVANGGAGDENTVLWGTLVVKGIV